MVVANNVSADGAGFESDDNEVVLVTRDSAPLALPRASKRALADQILDYAFKLRLSLQP